MKAKVISTGEIVELKEKVIFIDYARGMYRDSNGNKYHYSELEFIEERNQKTIDWKQRRYEIAKDIYLYKLSHSFNSVVNDAESSVLWADYLIEELKKGVQS